MKKIGLALLVLLFCLTSCKKKGTEDTPTVYTVKIVDEVFEDNNKEISVEPNQSIADELEQLKKQTMDYTFAGWFYEENGIQKVFGKDTPITADITIYVQWDTNLKHTVELIDTFFPKHNQTFQVLDGKKIPSSKLQVHDENEYEFVAWLDEKSEIFNPDTTLITKPVKLYAHWRKRTIQEVLDDYISILLESTNGYLPSWNREGFKGRWNYIDGVFLNSIVSLYKTTQDQNYIDFMLNYIDYYIDSKGNFINPKTGLQEGFRSGELDSICESRILFDAYEYTQDERYLVAIERTYQELQAIPKASGSPNFCHKTIYSDQIWLDGMYMYAPFYARYAQFKNQPALFEEIKEQYAYVRSAMFDEEKKLYYHGHDTTKSIFWANPTTGNSASFWLRSMGWYMVSLVDVLPYFPEGEAKTYLKGLLKEAVDGILQYQDEETKMFYQLVDLGKQQVTVPQRYITALKNPNYSHDVESVEIENYLESSGSSMIAYCLLEGNRLGYLNSTYYTKGKEIFEGIYLHSFKNSSLHDICITAGLGPETNEIRDGSAAYYLAEPVGENDAKGIGPFLMAYLAYNRDL